MSKYRLKQVHHIPGKHLPELTKQVNKILVNLDSSKLSKIDNPSRVRNLIANSASIKDGKIIFPKEIVSKVNFALESGELKKLENEVYQKVIEKEAYEAMKPVLKGKFRKVSGRPESVQEHKKRIKKEKLREAIQPVLKEKKKRKLRVIKKSTLFGKVKKLFRRRR